MQETNTSVRMPSWPCFEESCGCVGLSNKYEKKSKMCGFHPKYLGFDDYMPRSKTVTM